WQTVFYGFLGARLHPDGSLSLNPRLPKTWKALSLQICYRGYRLNIRLTPVVCNIEVDGSEGLGQGHLVIGESRYPLVDDQTIRVNCVKRGPIRRSARK
ncbi:hypothetical protein EBX31_14590, partial [bacterium]|nr:hypothetical protein [bacterium]